MSESSRAWVLGKLLLRQSEMQSLAGMWAGI